MAKDRQAQRQNQFDLQMAQRKQEFDSLLTVKKPPVPNFADDIDLANEKLSADSIKQMINQTVSQRNYELANDSTNTNTNNTENEKRELESTNINSNPDTHQSESASNPAEPTNNDSNHTNNS